MIKQLRDLFSIHRFLTRKLKFTLLLLVSATLAGNAQVHMGSLLDDYGAALWYTKSVYVSGNYAYVISDTDAGGCYYATPQTIEIIDIHNPDTPIHKGYIANTWGGALLSGANSIFVVGNYAYVTTGTSYANTCFTGPTNALEIIDISNPSAPMHKSSLVNGAGGAILSNPQSVYVSGVYAYVANYDNNTIEIIDVSDPANPVHKSNIAGGNKTGALLYGPKSIFVSGNYAYVASTVSNAVEVLDVSNPAAPVHASWIDGEGSAALVAPSSVYILNSYAYVTSTNALEIINVSNPLSPVHAGKLTISGANSVSVSGNVATVTTGNSNSLVVVNVSNPSSPSVSATITNGTGGAKLAKSNSVFTSGNYAYVSAPGSQALEIVNIANPSTPVHAGSISWQNGSIKKYSSNAVAVSGNYAYLASVYNSLQIVNVSNPAQPVAMGSLLDEAGGASLHNMNAISISGNYAYLVGRNNYLEIVDVTNASSPLHKGKVDIGPYGGYPRDIKVAGNYAYVNDANVFKIVNVTNPLTPSVTGSLSFGSGPASGFINSIYVSGSLAYVTCTDLGKFYIVNISNPLAPSIKGSIAITGVASCISLVGNNAYVATKSGLSIIDVTNPAFPVVKSTISGVTPFALINNLAYCVTTSPVFPYYFTLKIFNVSNPAAPLLVGSISSTQFPYYGFNNFGSGFVAGSNIYMAGFSGSDFPNIRGGLEIVQFSPLAISSFSPTNGIAGTTVTINGTNFSSTPSNNIVNFNGVAATVISSTATGITVTVPNGVTTGPIQVSQAGQIQVATSSTNFVVNSTPPNQTITFNAIPQQCSSGTYTLSATATSSLPVSYSSSNTSVATVTGNTLNIIGYGTSTITATQSGNSTYNAAPPVTQLLTVVSYTVSISSSNGLNICNTGNTTLTADAPSGATFSWSSSNGVSGSGNSITVFEPGTYYVTANWGGCDVTASIDIEMSGNGCLQTARVAATNQQPSKENAVEQKSHKVSIYPNAANNEVTVEVPLKAEQDTPVILYDLMGKISRSIVLKKGERTVTIPTTEVANGVYVLRIGQSNGANAGKVIIEHK